jgi:hypothetical protein
MKTFQQFSENLDQKILKINKSKPSVELKNILQNNKDAISPTMKADITTKNVNNIQNATFQNLSAASKLTAKVVKGIKA